MMPQNIHPEIANEQAEQALISKAAVREESVLPSALALRAAELACGLAWLPNTPSSDVAATRYSALVEALRPVLSALRDPLPTTGISEDYRWLHDNVRLIETELSGVGATLEPLENIPHVRTREKATLPRPIAVVEGFLVGTQFEFKEESFATYIEGFEEKTVLNVKELWALVPALKLELLEQIAIRAARLIADKEASTGIDVCIRSLREITQNSWKEAIEPLIFFDRVLRQDPAGAYARMDFDSRDLYRSKIIVIAAHSDCSEMEVAQAALELAQVAAKQTDITPRMRSRVSHVGFYLVAEGITLLHRRVAYKMPLGERIQSLLRMYPDEFYVPGIAVLTFAIMSVIVLLLTSANNSLEMIFLSMLALFLPASQSAVQVMNYLTTSLLSAQILPKLDFSESVPDDCVTLVAIPTLLLNEKQVRRLVDDLEVRFLGNHDPNLHFALVSDLPDSSEPSAEENPLIDLCSKLITELNAKYSRRNMGSFFLFHRHRVFNPREGVWMGWERKRGKLLDLNKLLRRQYDSFPVKVGDLSLLPNVRFVLTLDSDTELPRGSAQRMIGALAHPLNTAILDPEKNIVVAGYGILQPRVGISVQSAARSRLANIYSGQTGYDIYTHAVSDVYQDLFGEGSFAGKGIYEVETLHQVLDRRFPRNALLSHDLIEGAYARAGLVTDVEVIEDYPSHYSAYNRRKHRWLRGDWQITNWLLPQVPDESGNRVRNPISTISQWKIFDNLRRSLVEPATFLLLILGWFVLPGKPAYWTLATIVILFVPAWCRFLFELVHAAIERNTDIARDAVDGLFTSNVTVLLTLTFLAHQMLVSLDAVVRALVRRMVTGQRLLEWETAAEVELGIQKRTAVDVYLDWMPVLALALGALVFFAHRRAFWAAIPILLLWASSKGVARWLNRPPSTEHKQASEKDVQFLRSAALLTWRYFAEFSNAEHNWLIPDNLQEQPFVVAPRVSPTNLGLLLNARQVACEFGYLTVPEFTELTSRTLQTLSKLEHYRGHLLNWYNTQTLEALRPRFVSSVDNGNFLASLWTLQEGCLDRLARPIVEASSASGLLDHVRLLVELKGFSRKQYETLEDKVLADDWLRNLLELPEGSLNDEIAKSAKHPTEVNWFVQQAHARIKNIRQTVRLYSPWLLPEFTSLRNDAAISIGSDWGTVAIERIPDFIDLLTIRLEEVMSQSDHSDERRSTRQLLRNLLPEARTNALRLIEALQRIVSTIGDLSDEMGYGFLLNPKRKLLSVGYDVEKNELNAACYDLLASEARIASFVAIAKDDIPQESWFQFGRVHTSFEGRPLLVSWTGTMFEYLMPSIWMRSYPDTLLQRSREAAVVAQKAYTAQNRIPWGISESAAFRRDDAGNHEYHAFGVPGLAVHKAEFNGLVISPYSTFLALHEDPTSAVENLHRMAHEGWIGSYGFYESADFTSEGHRSKRSNYEVVRCWMAHHQGMSLLSIANFLLDGVVQGWFHNNPRVQATELLLHEKPLAHVPV
ncbi:MAG: Cyclic beta,2-glucan synthase [Acidobacteriaceae bacterium]|nr:Cyclic beta,2-glucan synthase [Acidobacteriaceae bacterium]